MIESREFNSRDESKDKLSFDEFESQYIAVLELISDAQQENDVDKIDMYTEKKNDLEKQNPLNHFKILNKDFISLIGSPSDMIINGIRQAVQCREKDYLEKVCLDLTGRLFKLPENQWAMWDATSGMNPREAEAYQDFAAAKLMDRLKRS